MKMEWGTEVSVETKNAITQISRFIALLTKDYHLDREDKLFPPEEQ